MRATRVRTAAHPYAASDHGQGLFEKGHWPCSWVALDKSCTFHFAAYRCRFSLPKPNRFLAHVAADEQYVLYLDGQEVGRGSERGTPECWYYDSFEFDLAAGDHVIVAKVSTLGPFAQRSQMSVHHGFLFSPQEPEYLSLLGTGHACWEAKSLDGHECSPPFRHHAYSRAANVTLHAEQFAWGFETGAGEDWVPVRSLHPGMTAGLANRYGNVHLLVPSALSPMLSEPFSATVLFVGGTEGGLERGSDLPAERAAWSRLLLDRFGCTIPARTRRRILLGFDDYYCGTSAVTLSGGQGGTMSLHWAESLFNEPEFRTKGDRREIWGKYFFGAGDTLCMDGGSQRRWEVPRLQAGRYVQIEIETAGDPLEIHSLDLTESRYPLEIESTFSSGDGPLDHLSALAQRSLEACSHDAFVDGPYYEQMMWIGDSRLMALASYTVTSDSALPRKALSIFNQSRLINGLTRARYPARDTVVLAPYSLWWIGMVYDHALWRGDHSFLQSLIPGVRGVLDGFAQLEDPDGRGIL